MNELPSQPEGERPSWPNPVLVISDDASEVEKLTEVLGEHKIETYIFWLGDEDSGQAKYNYWTSIFSYAKPIVVLGTIRRITDALASLLANDYVQHLPLQSEKYLDELNPPFWIVRDKCGAEALLWRSTPSRKLTFITSSHLRDCLSNKCKPPTSFLPLPTKNSLKEVMLQLERLPKAEYFDWPVTHISCFGGHSSKVKTPEKGVLRSMGYQVGNKGKPVSERRNILNKVFEGVALPQVADADYMAKWGTPCSTARLKKMANSLAAFAISAKGKKQQSITWIDLNRAIEHWEDDLAWLKRQYYDGHFDGSYQWSLLEVIKRSKKVEHLPTRHRSTPPKICPRRIVILDDEPSVAECLKMFVGHLFRRIKSLEVVTFTDADEAMQELSRHDPDLFTTDWNHTKISCLDMLKKLARKKVKYPVLVVSASADYIKNQQLIKLSRSTGLTVKLLPKPITVEDLKQSLSLHFNF